ncbi:MAG: hypothetical protein ACREU6_10990 [Steroidobacteraceae bacterium]
MLNMKAFKDFRCGLYMRASVRAMIVILTFAAAIVPTAVTAQNKQAARPDLSGVWVSMQTALDDPRWTIEDRVCRHCALPAMQRLHMVLNDPKSAHRPLKQIMDEITAFNKKYVFDLLTDTALAYQARFDPARDDPVLACKPVGLFTEAEGIYPLQIEQYDDRVVFRYEYFGLVRTVYTDGRGHPSDLKPSGLGHSIGWYDGDTLVVDTVGIKPHLVGVFIVPGIRTSSHARGIERYTRSKDGNSLDFEMTIIDPWTFRQPLVLFKKNFLYAPKEKLQRDDCTVAPEYLHDLQTKSAPK